MAVERSGGGLGWGSISGIEDRKYKYIDEGWLENRYWKS